MTGLRLQAKKHGILTVKHQIKGNSLHTAVALANTFSGQPKTVVSANMDTNISHSNSTTNPLSLTFQDALPGIAIGIVIFIINIFTLSAIVLFEKVKERCTVLVGSLCVSDALSGISLILSSLNVITHLLNDRCPSNISGYLYNFAVYIPILVSQWHIFGLSVDRLIAVVQPLKYHSIMTPGRIKIIVLVIWIFGSLDSVLTMTMACVHTLVTDLLILAHLVLIFCFVAAVYTHLWRVAKRHRIQIAEMQSHQESQSQPPSTNKATRVILVLFALFVVFYLPFFVVKSIETLSTGSMKQKAQEVIQYAQIGAYVFSAMNCFIYVFLNRDIRTTLLQKCQCFCFAKS